MNANVTVNVRLATNEFLFSFAMAPHTSEAESADAATQLLPAPVTRVLPVGSSAIAPGLSAVICDAPAARVA